RDNPFNWLVFLDRFAINPMELLQVLAFKPHELTQQFVAPDSPGAAATKLNHRAPWFNPDARLYRLLEFLEGGERMQGVTVGGRTIGKINLNTIWDPETFLALCDAKGINHFTDLQVYNPNDNPSNPQSVYWKMLKTRTPGYNPATGAGGLGPNDRPFRGLAA